MDDDILRALYERVAGAKTMGAPSPGLAQPIATQQNVGMMGGWTDMPQDTGQGRDWRGLLSNMAGAGMDESKRRMEILKRVLGSFGFGGGAS